MGLVARYSCVIFSVVCFSMSVSAATIYVDDDGPNDPGICDSSVSDLLEDGSETHPFDRIQEAIDTAVEGDVIKTAAGVYYENVRILLKNNITLIGEGSNVTTINGGGNGHVVSFNISDGAISGFTLTNSGTKYLYYSGLFTSQCDVIVDKCIIKHNARGLVFSSGSNGYIYNSTVFGNFTNGVEYSQSSGIVKNCVIIKNQWHGFNIVDSSVDIVNNTIYNNYNFAIYCVPSGNMKISNNIISKHDYGVMSSGQNSTDYLHISHNNCHDNDNNYWYEWSIVSTSGGGSGESRAFTPVPGTGEISVDPRFANLAGEDYHLKSQHGRWSELLGKWVYDQVTSPCVDAGEPSDAGWKNELWPHGKRINVGAHGGTPQASMSANQVGRVADFDHDDEVGVMDILMIAEDWLTQEKLLDTDIDRNGNVDMVDFAELAKSYLN